MFKKFRKLLFHQQDIIIISHHGIKCKKFDFVSYLVCFILTLWTFFATARYFEYRDVVIAKDLQIIDLYSSNSVLRRELKVMGRDVNDIKGYIQALNSYDRFDGVNDYAEYSYEGRDSLARVDTLTLAVLDRVKSNVEHVNIALEDRIQGLNNVTTALKLQTKDREEYDSSNFALASFSEADVKVERPLFVENSFRSRDRVHYLNYLEGFVDTVPLAYPMDDYYISSRFGARRDPFTKKRKSHHGIDFVGNWNAKIKATSKGVVSFVGRRGGYGKIVEIYHGFGMKTEYGHLKKAFVKIGQEIKRGEVLGLQGNTGRSTGPHLHYEVRYKNKPYDPMKFLRAGDKIF